MSSVSLMMEVMVRTLGGVMLSTMRRYPALSSLVNLQEPACHGVGFVGRLFWPVAHTTVSCSLVPELGITVSEADGPSFRAPVPRGMPSVKGV